LRYFCPLLTSRNSAVHHCTGSGFLTGLARPPRVRVGNLPPMQPPHLHFRVRVVSGFFPPVRTSFCLANSSALSLPSMRFLFVGSGFCLRMLSHPLLQIPPRSGHPCLWLRTSGPLLLTTKRIADFHRQVTAHAGRTKKSPVPFREQGRTRTPVNFMNRGSRLNYPSW
jgi:hypothetical protein